MSQYPTLELNDGRKLPQLGFGTWQIPEDDVAGIVSQALKTGYELVDTAAIYKNESGVGEGLSDAPDIFLQTKIWNADQGYSQTKAAFAEALDRLGRADVDMLLIHWPCPANDKYVDTWKAMIELREAGKAKSIGVSNFRPEDLERLVKETGVTPALNQIELHPGFQQRELCAVHDDMGIVTQSWSPLGQGKAMANGPIAGIARTLKAEPAAVVIAWHLHHGFAPLPKASSKEHMEANFTALKLRLTDEQIAAIDALNDADGRMGPDPDEFNLT